jgi:hypothetical protein
VPQQLSTIEQADHDRSVYDYPYLDLNDDEYVVIDVKRSVAGRVYIWLGTILGILVFAALAVVTYFFQSGLNIWQLIVALCLFGAVITLVVGIISSRIYRKNYLIVTNQRVFGQAQSTLFSFQTQSLELEHVEDISFAQTGILSMVFDYGTLRLSTVGDEHTYRLTFVDNPSGQIKIIKKLVSAVDEGEATIYKGKS